ncbi:endonuclease [Bacteroidota bacterium]
MRKTILTGIIAIVVQTIVFSQPAGYYDSAEGKSGAELQQALHDIIDDHTILSYSYLWTAFNTTDDRPDGTVWDMYSDVPDGPNPYDYTFGEDQCGDYSGEGSCYNREHSFPKSWFGDLSPMNTDLFHLYPTDGSVNGMRGNYPFGETSIPTKTSLNGCKVGPCSVAGYSGTIFEPIDEYKGDFARTYFYMATRYYGEDGSWVGSPMVDGAQAKPWAKAMLIQWHTDDPVSTKEQERNDAVFELQDNRNPFIDHPEYVIMLYEEGSIDEMPPEVDSIVVISSDSLVLWFNEALDQVSAENSSNYQLSTDAVVEDAKMLAGHSNTVGLGLAGVKNGSYSMIINGISDTSGNPMVFAIYNFTVNLLSYSDFQTEQLAVYPNPNNGNFFISYRTLGRKIKTIELYDISGRNSPIDQHDLGDLMHITSSANPGIYNLYLVFEGGLKLFGPLIVQ